MRCMDRQAHRQPAIFPDILLEEQKKSYLLASFVLGGLLGGDGLLRAALLEHRLRDDGFGLGAHHGWHDFPYF